MNQTRYRMKIYFGFLMLFVAQISFAQKSDVTKIIDQIEIEQDTIQAVFTWVTDNVAYDVKKLKKLKEGANFYKEGKFKSSEEYRAHLLATVIKKKKGVCDDYTLLFNALVTELGYESKIISGVTKGKGGKIRGKIGHSWNAVKVNNEWKLYDPTWGAGSVKDDKKFIKRYNTKWYETNPEVMNETHLPFDPIWQLSNRPITFQEFKKSQASSMETDYDYNQMIADHHQKSDNDRIKDEIARLDLNGGSIRAIKKQRDYLKSKIASNTVPELVDGCKTWSAEFRDCERMGKLQKFTDEKWTPEYCESILLELKSNFEEAIVAFNGVDVSDRSSRKSLKKLIAKSKKMVKKIDKELILVRAAM